MTVKAISVNSFKLMLLYNQNQTRKQLRSYNSFHFKDRVFKDLTSGAFYKI